MTQAFLSQAGLARRLRISENTLAVRIRALRLMPDGVMVQDKNPDVLLFAVERLPKLSEAISRSGVRSSVQSEIKP